ncbi:hypothetical protein BD779DRAFT_1471007 [Infundibulicybe gibba]|nr:hypothetical protein BD779DRAFT_1471007 [Infundibulicybe gibba]
MAEMENKPTDERDEVLQQWTMWNCDVLPYLELRDAIKIGDVGRMEDLLPTLLFRFAGGGNSKYAIEILELLQGLYREWPDLVKDYVRKWCWLINRTGKRDGNLPIDLGQEENIGDVKVHYHSMGPGATMEYMKKVSPSIPGQRRVQRHIEREFNTLTRGAHHGTPDKELDVDILTKNYMESHLHTYVAGRKHKISSNKASDVTTIGAVNLERLKTIDEWFERRSHGRSSQEDWDELFSHSA